ATWPRRPRPWRELAAIVLAAGCLIVPWIGWSASVYGPDALVTTTAAYRDAKGYEGPSHVTKGALNVVDTVLPHFVRGLSTDVRSAPGTWGGLREVTFMAYMSNLWFAPGVFGAALLLLDRMRGRRGRAPGGAPGGGAGAGFWVGFVVAGFAGLAANGVRQTTG